MAASVRRRPRDCNCAGLAPAGAGSCLAAALGLARAWQSTATATGQTVPPASRFSSSMVPLCKPTGGEGAHRSQPEGSHFSAPQTTVSLSLSFYLLSSKCCLSLLRATQPAPLYPLPVWSPQRVAPNTKSPDWTETILFNGYRAQSTYSRGAPASPSRGKGELAARPGR